jgi:SLT domain-containing protein
MASLGIVFVDVKMDDNQVRGETHRTGLHVVDELGRAGADGGRKAGDHFTSSLRTSVSAGPLRAVGAHIGTSLLAGFTAVGVAAGIGKVLSTGFGEVSDYQKGLAQLNAGLKSTGGAAGITSGQMEDLASKIQAYSGQTDDSIVATEQLLLTFTNIRNEAGKNNDVFTQTTTIAADMAARLGGDASSAAIQLGKALNDPVKGITALTRVGVSFSDAQKKAIADDVKRNDTLSAQKVILAELTKEFGGSAKAVGETLPGQVERAKRSFEDFSQSIVGTIAPLANGFLPLLQKGLDSIGPKLQEAAKQLPEIVNVFKTSFQTHGNDVTTQGFLGIVGNLGAAARNLYDQVKPGFDDIVTAIKQTVLPTLRNLWEAFKGPLVDALGIAVGAFREFAKLLKDDIGPAIRDTSKWLADHRDLVKFVTIDVLAMWTAYKGYTILTSVVASVKALTGAIGGLDVAISANPVGALIIALGLTAAAAYELYKNWDAIWSAIARNRDLALVATILGGPVVIAIASVGVTLKAVQTIWTGGWAGMRRVAVEGARTIADAFLGMASAIVHGAAFAFGWIPKIGDPLKGAAKAFDEFRDHLNNDVFPSLEGTHVIHVNVRTAVGDSAAAISLPNKASQYAAGGLIRGAGGPRDDMIPAYLSNGEAVVPAHLVPKYAGSFAQDGIPGFADGGLVVQTNAASAAGPLGAQLKQSIDAALQNIAASFASFSGVIGAGVQQWSGLVSQVLGMLGLSPGLLGKVLSQMTTESGGNPNAINLTDSNARAGTPSIGLMQVIGPTFAAYAGPYASLGITNPLANVYAGLNYAAHRYGPNLNGLGQGHGYDAGGRWPSGTLGWNTSGKDEYVITHGEMTEAVSLLRQLVGLTAKQPGAIVGGLNTTARGARLDARTRTR